VLEKLLFSITSFLLLGGGLYFSINLGFPQLKLKKLFKGLKSKQNLGITPFKSLMMSLAARIGVGSIAGIALAIYIGGIGTIFWIWIVCIITSINSYCESYLGYKYHGGPSSYIRNKVISKIYAILIIFAYIIGFMAIQANTITVSVCNYININPKTVSIILVIITLLSIIKGLKSIINITSKLVPIMGISYIILSLIIILKNINIIPQVLISIIKSAWNIKSLIPALLIGITRGTFATEAGLGTGAISSSLVKTNNNEIELSLVQILGIYFTVFIVCTSTALIIITSKYYCLNFNNINGIELTQYALNYHLGKYGSIILLISIIMLAYSTIIAGYYYGESSLKYLSKSKISIYILKILTLVLLYIGSLSSSNSLWNIVDYFVSLLAIINMITLLKHRKEIIFDYKSKL